MSFIASVFLALGLYIMVSYVVGFMSYKRNGCGLDTLAFLASPLLLPYVVRDWLRDLKYKVCGK